MVRRGAFLVLEILALTLSVGSEDSALIMTVTRRRRPGFERRRLSPLWLRTVKLTHIERSAGVTHEPTNAQTECQSVIV